MSLLEELVKIPSIFPMEDDLAKFIDDFVKKNLECKSYKVNVSPKRDNLLYTKGEGKKSILLVGHLDTVPVVEGWETSSFEPLVKSGNLYGLGAWDMKAGIYIILQCLKEFEPKNIQLKVAFTVDEENYSIGAHKLIDSGLCKNVDFVLIPEPGFQEGEHGITAGRTGRVTYVINILGKSAHGTSSSEGINAISQASSFLDEISKMKLGEYSEKDKSIIFPRAFYSTAKGFSVPDEAQIEIDCKLVAPDTQESIFEKIKEVAEKMFKDKKLANLPKITFKERPTPFCAPYRINENNKYFKICRKVAEKAFGKVKVIYNDSVADECIFVKRLKVPAICIGPSGANAHKANEYVNLESVERVKEIYLNILREIDRTKI